VFWQGHRSTPVHRADSLYVDALAVGPEFRRRGVAIALLEHAASTAVNNGLRSVSLDTAEINSPAVALYRRAGFEVAQAVPARPPMPAILAFRRPVGA
jgi:ribosomal protein S18 acetylase RimI-like enzyme